jgi:hypothetical protein
VHGWVWFLCCAFRVNSYNWVQNSACFVLTYVEPGFVLFRIWKPSLHFPSEKCANLARRYIMFARSLSKKVLSFLVFLFFFFSSFLLCLSLYFSISLSLYLSISLSLALTLALTISLSLSPWFFSQHASSYSCTWMV